MRSIPKTGSGVDAGTSGFASPAVVVVLVLLLGATIYLWRARYMRRRTAYVTMFVLVVAIIASGAWLYINPT